MYVRVYVRVRDTSANVSVNDVARFLCKSMGKSVCICRYGGGRMGNEGWGRETVIVYGALFGRVRKDTHVFFGQYVLV